MKETIVVGLIVLLIPLVAFGVSSWVQGGYESKIQFEVKTEDNNTIKNGTPTLGAICNMGDLPPELKDICGTYKNVGLMKQISICAFGLGIFLILFISISGYLSKSNRNLLLLLFKPGLFLMLISTILLVIGNAYLLIASIFYGEDALIGRIHFGLIVVIGLGATYAAIEVILAMLEIGKKASVKVTGKVVTPQEQRNLFGFVTELSQKLGTVVPDKIILGLEPNFFVTEADVECLDGKLKGRTMYLSLPLCRILTKGELKAVLSHELGHFKGEDTQFSQKFYPIYKGTIDSLIGIEKHMDSTSKTITLLPAYYMLAFFLSSFAESETEISRRRELEADQLASNTAGSEDASYALVKIYAFCESWDGVLGEMCKEIEHNRRIKNASITFGTHVVGKKDSFNYDALEKSHFTHPTDSHPSLWIRLAWINEKEFDINREKITNRFHENSIELISNPEDIEQLLTESENQALIDSVAVIPGLALQKKQ